MSDFVQFFEDRHLRNLQREMERVMVEEAPKDASDVLLNYIRASIRFRAIRSGALMRSPEEAFERHGLKGTATVFSDLFYAKFIEWGTGQRGAGSGATPPPDYVYGPRPGMAAREPFRLAMEAAIPEVVKVFERHARRLRNESGG